MPLIVQQVATFVFTDDQICFSSSLQVIECLKENKRQLTQRCHQRIFKLQEVEMVDPELDYQLMRVCKHMIRVGQNQPTTESHQHRSSLTNEIYMFRICLNFHSTDKNLIYESESGCLWNINDAACCVHSCL